MDQANATAGSHFSLQNSYQRCLYPPYQYILDIDKINYSISEQIEVIRRLKHPLINLSSGVNLIAPPKILLEEVGNAIIHPTFHQEYDGPLGHLVGRRAVQVHHSLISKHDLLLGDERILVTSGAAMALHLLSTYYSALYPGAEVLVPVPTFPLAAATMEFVGMRIREVVHRGEDRFAPTLNELRAARTDKTRLLILNIFNNPTGECYDEKEIRGILQWARDWQITVICDQVSIDLPASDAPNILDLAYELDYLDGVLLVSSISKDRSLPGLRVGWIIGPLRVIKEISRYNELFVQASPTPTAALLFADMLLRTITTLQTAPSTDDTEPASVAEAFIERVYTLIDIIPCLRDFLKPYENRAYLTEMITEYQRWRDELLSLLTRNWNLVSSVAGARMVPGAAWRGGFNTFVQLPELQGADPMDFTTSLFRNQGVQILPGPCFWSRESREVSGDGFWLRVSFAMKSDKLKRGIVKLLSYAEGYG